MKYALHHLERVCEERPCFTLFIMELFQSNLLTFDAIAVIKLMPMIVYMMVCLRWAKPYLCERTHRCVDVGPVWNSWRVPGNVFIVGFKSVVY